MTESSPNPPIARKDHKETVLHGITLTDDYAWLREKDSPEVTAYLNAENAYAEAVTADLAASARPALQRDAEPHQAD